MLGRSLWSQYLTRSLSGTTQLFKGETRVPESRRFTLSRRSLGRIWTEREERILIDGRRAGKSAPEIMPQLQDRTVYAIHDRYQNLIKRGIINAPWRSKKWTPEENKRIRAAKANGMGLVATWDLFPDKTYRSVEAQCALLHQGSIINVCDAQPQRGKLTPDQDCTLIKLRSEGKRWVDIEQIMHGRSSAVLRDRYRRLVPPPERIEVTNHRGTMFSQSEAETFEELAARGLSVEDIAKKMSHPVRSTKLKLRRWRLGETNWQGRNAGRLWTADSVETLKMMYATGRLLDDIARRMGRSLHSTRRKLDTLTREDPSLA